MPGFRHGCQGPNSGPQACTALYLVDHPQSHPTPHLSPPHPTTTGHVLPSVCFSWQCLCISLTKPPVFRRPLLLGVLLLLNRTVLGATVVERTWKPPENGEKPLVSFRPRPPHLRSICGVQPGDCITITSPAPPNIETFLQTWELSANISHPCILTEFLQHRHTAQETH